MRILTGHSLLLVLLLSSVAESRGIVFGGFSGVRGGDFSPVAGHLASDFREHVTNSFENVSFTSSDTLTPAFLDTVDVLLLAAPSGDFTAIEPLSPEEQVAMYNFVLAGGRALLFTDNGGFETAGDSFVSPFDVDAAGTIFGNTAVTVTNLTHPIVNGPFGTVTNFPVSYPGWFGSIGSNAVAIGIIEDVSQVALAVIDPKVLSSTSGQVVFFSDSVLRDATFVQSTGNLIDNSLQFVGSLPRPRLTVQLTNAASVLVSWPTNHAGYRLLQSTNLASGNWVEVNLTGVNRALLSATAPAAYFRLIKP